MSASFRLTGLIAAPFTPFHPDGTLNPTAVAPMCDLLAETGVTGAFVAGSTGEGPSLSGEERRALTEAWVAGSKGRLKVVVHVGHTSLPEAVALAAHAQDAGADAVSAVAPSYFKPASLHELVDFLAPVAAAAPRLPFYYYDIPPLTGVSFPTAEFLARAADRMPTLAGVKFSNADLMSMQECLAADGGRFDVVFGSDESLLAALALGVRGAVGTTYNYAAPVYHRVIRAFGRGDLATARREQLRSVELIRHQVRFGVLRSGKALMGRLGVECGPVRPPLKAIAPEETQAFVDAVRHLEVFSRPIG